VDKGTGFVRIGNEIPVQHQQLQTHIIIIQEKKTLHEEDKANNNHHKEREAAVSTHSSSSPLLDDVDVDVDVILLSHHIPSGRLYSLQGPTIVTWTMPDDSTEVEEGATRDVAMSFQESDKCEQVWKYLQTFPEVMAAEEDMEEEEEQQQQEEEESNGNNSNGNNNKAAHEDEEDDEEEEEDHPSAENDSDDVTNRRRKRRKSGKVKRHKKSRESSADDNGSYAVEIGEDSDWAQVSVHSSLSHIASLVETKSSQLQVESHLYTISKGSLF
jgi:hypothetical protein